MIYVALGMLGFGISDLVRWSPDGVGARRAVVAAAFGAGAVSLVAALSGFEGTLRGGRLLGPMERVIVAAGVVSGGVAAAAFVIAAKGLLRFREIRSVSEDGGGAEQARIDEVTEYFLVGTFASVLLAAAVGVLVLAAG